MEGGGGALPLYDTHKRYSIIDQQIERYLVSLPPPLPFDATQIINPFLT